MAHGGHSGETIRERRGLCPRRSFYSFILFSGSASEMGAPPFSGRGDGWNITYAVASEAARFSATPPPLHGSIFPPAAYTPQPRPRAPRRRGRGYTQPGPRPGDNINHRGSVGTCKEGYGPTTAPVCCSMATVTRCNRFYGSTSTPVPPEPWERVKPLQNASAPITPALAPSSHLWPR